MFKMILMAIGGELFYTDAVHAPANAIERTVNWHWGTAAMKRSFISLPHF